MLWGKRISASIRGLGFWSNLMKLNLNSSLGNDVCLISVFELHELYKFVMKWKLGFGEN